MSGLTTNIQQAKTIKEVIREEYAKCVVYPIYFLKKYGVIQHPQRGKIRFSLFEYQDEVIDAFLQFDYNIILKSRQLGLSTVIAGYCLWLMLFHDDKNILVIAKDKETAKNLVTKVRVMHENLPSWLKGNCIEDNKLSLKFANGSNIKAVAATPDAGRSEALSLLILDEAAFIDYIEEIWAAALPALSTGGKCIMLSTPNGVGNMFHKVWVKAEDREVISEGVKRITFNPIRLHWSRHPERDQDWRDEQDELLGPKRASQECDCDYLTSGTSVVDGTILEFYKKTYVTEPMMLEENGALWIWELPDYSKNYILSADISRGDGTDYSTFHVFEAESMEQVAEFKDLIPTTDFGNLLVNIATKYNDAYLIIDNIGLGWAVINTVTSRGYRNLHYSLRGKDFFDDNAKIMKGLDLIGDESKIPGFITTAINRPLMISKMETYMREKLVTVKSKRLIDELFVFIYNGKRAEARKGYNDDLVMAFCMALYVRDNVLQLRQLGIELTKSALNSTKMSTTPYPGIVSSINKNSPYNPWQINMGNMNENIDWLINNESKEKSRKEAERIHEFYKKK